MMRHRMLPALLAVALGAILAAAPAQATTICDVQAYDSSGFSPLTGQTVTVRGEVTVPPGIFLADYQYTSIYVEQGDCGVNVFYAGLLPYQLSLGDSVEVTGLVEEYVSAAGAGSTTELYCSSSAGIQLVSSGHPEPVPPDLDLAVVAQEASEGRFVRTIGIVLDNNFDYSMYIGDPFSGASIQVYSNNNANLDFTLFVPGDTLEVTGVVLQYDRAAPYFEGYELVPRYQSDIQFATPPTPSSRFRRRRSVPTWETSCRSSTPRPVAAGRRSRSTISRGVW
jgi:hypothetical protein